MKRLRDIRRAKEIQVRQATIWFGSGIVEINGWRGTVVWGSDEYGWEHVSVSPFDHSITPSWDDMCRLKDIFFDDEELVIQIHPPKSQYVNMQENCLHLWKPKSTAALKSLSNAGRNINK